MNTIIKTILCFTVLCLSQTASANYAQRKDVQQFVAEMAREHGFDHKALLKKFARAEKLDDVLESIAKPAEKTLSWFQYRPIFITPNRINLGVEFMEKHGELLARAEKKYGVPAHIITAIIGVETYYGRHRGRTDVFDSLVTLGFDYPPRSKFFKSELEQFLLLAREEKIDETDIKGSYAGAMGIPQFISSSYRRYAVDFDGDGKRDLWHSMADVIGSVANYFSVHGWEQNQSVVHRVRVRKPLTSNNRLKPHTTVAQYRSKGVIIDQAVPADALATLLVLKGDDGPEYWLGLKNFYVITRYNHSVLYAMAVYQLSHALVANTATT